MTEAIFGIRKLRRGVCRKSLYLFWNFPESEYAPKQSFRCCCLHHIPFSVYIFLCFLFDSFFCVTLPLLFGFPPTLTQTAGMNTKRHKKRKQTFLILWEKLWLVQLDTSCSDAVFSFSIQPPDGDELSNWMTSSNLWARLSPVPYILLYTSGFHSSHICSGRTPH